MLEQSEAGRCTHKNRNNKRTKYKIPLQHERDFFLLHQTKMKKIAIQGIKGSFHDIAAHQYFKGEDIELICCDTFEKVFDEMRHEGSLFALVAIENTIAGSLLHNWRVVLRLWANINCR